MAENPEDGIKYPGITVVLTGTSTNAFSIMSEVTIALKAHKVPITEVNAFRREAMSGTYEELIQTAMRWVNVE